MSRLLIALALYFSLITSASSLEPAGKTRYVANLEFAKRGSQSLKLDLAIPTTGTGPFPTLVCIHGGGWVRGSRQQMKQTIQSLALRGYVAVTIDYRLAPTSRFPAQIEDCKEAIRWLRANAKKYRINPSRMGALGFSAGAHLACLVGVTKLEDGLEGKSKYPKESSEVQAVASFFGPVDLTDPTFEEIVRKNNLRPLLGGTLAQKKEAYQKASPISYVRKGTPPFLFFHGTEDRIVPLKQVQRMKKKLQSVGTSATLFTLPGEGHGWKGKMLVATIEQMMRFFDQTLKK